MAKAAHVVGTSTSNGFGLPLSTGALTLLHQADQQAGTFDLITIWVTNTDPSTTYSCSIFWGADTDPDCKFPMTIPPGVGPCCIVPGWPLERGYTVKAQASVAGKLNVITLVSPISSYT